MAYFCLTIIHLIDYFKFYYFSQDACDLSAKSMDSRLTWESTVRSYLLIRIAVIVKSRRSVIPELVRHPVHIEKTRSRLSPG